MEHQYLSEGDESHDHIHFCTCVICMHTVHINMRIASNLRPLSDLYFTVRCPRIGSCILKTHIISWDVFGTRSIANRSEINSSVQHRYARHAWKLGWSRFRENTRHRIVCWTASSDTILADFSSFVYYFCIIYTIWNALFVRDVFIRTYKYANNLNSFRVQ